MTVILGVRDADAGARTAAELEAAAGGYGDDVGQPSMPYSSSKTALNAITVHYARELADTPIKVNAAAPGHVATAFSGFRGTRTPEEGAAIAIRLVALDHVGDESRHRGSWVVGRKVGRRTSGSMAMAGTTLPPTDRKRAMPSTKGSDYFLA